MATDSSDTGYYKLPQPEKKSPKIPPMPGKFIIIFAVVIIFGFTAGFLTSFVMGRLSVLEIFLYLLPGNVFIEESNVLILGVDATPGAKRSDTIIVAHIQPEQKTVGVVSIPRDTRVNIPGRGLDKINHAYAFGGVELAAQTVSDFLGVPIPYYVKVDVDGLASIIDRLGGVEVDVDERMYYVDSAGGLYVNLMPGHQKLRGKELIGYVRFRQGMGGDIGRVKRQQKFLQSVADQLLAPLNYAKVPGLVSEISACVETNLSSRQLLGLSSVLRQANDLGQVQMEYLPGRGEMINGVYYIQPDQAKLKRLAATVLKGQLTKKKALKAPQKFVSKPSSKILSKTAIPVDRESMKIEVLNGNGKRGLAQRVGGALKGHGFKVVRRGDAAHFNYPKTTIIDWKGRGDMAESLSEFLNIDIENISHEDRPSKDVDFTIVLGGDWSEIATFTRVF